MQCITLYNASKKEDELAAIAQMTVQKLDAIIAVGEYASLEYK